MKKKRTLQNRVVVSYISITTHCYDNGHSTVSTYPLVFVTGLLLRAWEVKRRLDTWCKVASIGWSALAFGLS